MNYSFGLLKPDCLKRGVEKEVLAEIEASGLGIVAIKRVRLTREEIDVIWAPCVAEYFYEDLLEFSMSGDSLVFIVRGENAIDRLTDLVGHYESDLAEKGTIRHRFGTSAMENVIHSTNDEETFWVESLLFFSRLELDKLINGEK